MVARSRRSLSGSAYASTTAPPVGNTIIVESHSCCQAAPAATRLQHSSPSGAHTNATTPLLCQAPHANTAEPLVIEWRQCQHGCTPRRQVAPYVPTHPRCASPSGASADAPGLVVAKRHRRKHGRTSHWQVAPCANAADRSLPSGASAGATETAITNRRPCQCSHTARWRETPMPTYSQAALSCTARWHSYQRGGHPLLPSGTCASVATPVAMALATQGNERSGRVTMGVAC